MRYRLQKLLEQGPAGVRRIVVERLSSQLELSPDQRKIVDRAIAEAQDEAAPIREEVRPRIESIIDGVIARINPHLSPEQRGQLALLYARAKEKWKRTQ
jgi:hypothetical protein